MRVKSLKVLASLFFFFLLGEGCPRRAIAEDVGQDKVIETKLTRHPFPAGALSGHWIDQLPT